MELEYIDLKKLIDNIKPEHVISMAVAFIFLLSACVSLLISANVKIERISSRFRRACELWRNPDCSVANRQQRREYLKEQIDHFYRRYETMQRVQKLLFWAICLFIVAYIFYIFASVFLVTGISLRDPAHPPMWLIACTLVTLGLITILFFVGIWLLLTAARLQIKETADSHKTLDWERKDITSFCDDTPNNGMHPTADTLLVIYSQRSRAGG